MSNKSQKKTDLLFKKAFEALNKEREPGWRTPTKGRNAKRFQHRRAIAKIEERNKK